MFMCGPWRLAQGAVSFSAQLCLDCFASSLHSPPSNCHHELFHLPSFEKSDLNFISFQAEEAKVPRCLTP